MHPEHATVAVMLLPPVSVQSMSPFKKLGSVAAELLTVMESPPPEEQTCHSNASPVSSYVRQYSSVGEFAASRSDSFTPSGLTTSTT